MVRQIVTQEAVNQAANALVLEGIEPSILNIQSRIGAGSYTTVKKYLDAWKLAQAQANNTEPPDEVKAKGAEFTRSMWALAVQEAQQEVQAIKAESREQVVSAQNELAAAMSEVARLEQIEAQQSEAIERQQTRLREAELALAEARAQAQRVPELEQTITQVRAELDTARHEVTQKSVEAGRLSGESEALRAQVRELLATINSRPA